MHCKKAKAEAKRRCNMSVMQLAVCGLHMRGLPLEHQLVSLGATFQRACKSSPIYRFYSITDLKTRVRKPGMIAVGKAEGAAIELEVWDLPINNVGSFLLQIPEPLGLGTVWLESDESVKGFICEGYIASLGRAVSDAKSSSAKFDVEDITQYRSWKAFVAQQSTQS